MNPIPIENILGVLRLTIKRGINLPVRDVDSSDPYIILCLGTQKVKTRTVYDTVNPVWNEELTLCVLKGKEHETLQVNVYDNDILFDDRLGDAEVDLKPFLESVNMMEKGMEDGTIIAKVKPGRENCLVEKSNIVWINGSVTQNMFLRLRNVECGEIELHMLWIDGSSLRA
ncbi:hypothetical protein RND81_03G089400 [Saponaria officinalis]|uniref:C2 domain-containing protein n=1 Tax=Saponaria officinalis TaxID=3572 RepID=A0AAW1M5F9_SAPOF